MSASASGITPEAASCNAKSISSDDPFKQWIKLPNEQHPISRTNSLSLGDAGEIIKILRGKPIDETTLEWARNKISQLTLSELSTRVELIALKAKIAVCQFFKRPVKDLEIQMARALANGLKDSSVVKTAIEHQYTDSSDIDELSIKEEEKKA